jgi:hypothetical protein
MRFRFLLGSLGLVCVGCPNPNTFTVPRTVPAGRVQHTISVEAIGVAGGDDAAYLPAPPSYTARIGAADRIDVGIHISHMSSLGLDLKWNPVRTPGFDLAIDPGAQGFYIAGGGESVFIWYLHAPLLLGINPSTTTTILFTPGISVIGASAESDSTFSGSSSASDSALLARIGVGANFHSSKKFAVQPEVTFLVPVGTEGDGGVIFLAGVGFNIGAQPDYGQE